MVSGVITSEFDSCLTGNEDSEITFFKLFFTNERYLYYMLSVPAKIVTTFQIVRNDAKI